MEVVVDTSVFLAVALGEPQRAAIIAETAGAVALAPEILPYEIGNALSAMVKRGKLSASEALAVYTAATRIAVRTVRVDVAGALRLAAEQRIYAYDAYFLHCALALSRPLLTLDRGMCQTAERLGLKLLRVLS